MGLFIVVDLFMNLEDFTAGAEDFASVVTYIAKFYGYKSFQIFDHLCESVVLLAGTFTVAWMQRNNELLPLLSAGVPTQRVVRPVLFCACGMMVLASVNQEFGLSSIDAFMMENRRNADGAKETDVKGEFDLNGILVSGRTVVKKEGLIKDFDAIIPARLGHNSITHVKAKEAYFIAEKPDDKRSGGWLLKQATVSGQTDWPDDDDEPLKPLGDGSYFLRTKDVDLDTVIRVKNWHLYLPTWRILKELDRPGNTQHASLAVVFHSRMTRPIMGMILVILGLSVILRDQNRNVFISAGMCLGIAAIFFTTIFACQGLGKDELASQYVSPALAAWLPVIIFGPLALVMYDAVHT
jgi:lipopolysaccharide export system permease protein